MHRNEIFQNYLSIGFQQINERRGAYEEMSKVYDYNFNTLLPSQLNNPKILDIGCGMGHFLYYLKKMGYREYLGIDISQEAIEYCKQKITQNVILINDLSNFLKKNTAKFDAIVMNDIIEHLPKNEIIEILLDIRNTLRDNGVIIIKTNNSSNLFGALMRDNDFTHEVGFTEYSLTQILKIVKFRNIQAIDYKFPKAGIKRAIRLFLINVLHIINKIAYYIEFHDVSRIFSSYIIVKGTK